MSNYRRDYTRGGVYFFTVVLQDRRNDWLVRYIDEFRSAWRETALRYPWETIAVVVLPEHFHCVMKLPDDDFDYSRRLQLLKSVFSRKLPADCCAPNPSQARKRESGIWQRRFWEHRIRDDGDLARHVAYTYYNPVKHGHVRRVGDWAYSSFHRDVQSGIFSPDWGGDLSKETCGLYGD